AALERWFERRGETDPELRIELLTARRLMRTSWADPTAGDEGSASERTPVDIPRRLPAELRFYLEGADAYRRQDLEIAVERWLTLLELEDNDRRERSVMAHYMLGRTYARLAGFDGQARPDAVEPALDHFAAARRLAGGGWRDDLGLAHESLGWEARFQLHRGHAPRALRLYAEQLASDNPTAADSIAVAASALSRADAEALEKAAMDPAVRDIYSLYLTAYGHYLGDAAVRWLDSAEAAAASGDELAAAGTLAWVAYQHGRFGDAERWLKLTDGGDPFVPWLRSKLATRNGDFDLARAELDAAAKALGEQPELILTESPNGYWRWAAAERARAEAGALELERGRYASSLDELLKAGYWMDAAYVAERVMTVEELRNYVDGEWPEDALSESTSRWWGGRTPFDTDAIAGEIRDLLARRLAREGRWEAAQLYFAEGLGDLAAQVGSLLARGQDLELTDGERADALWRVAQTLRDHGLELLATELDPDWRIWEGQFDLGRFGRRDPPSREAERARQALARPNARFHYRYVAAELGWQAADLLPNQSDHTARVLLTAGTWLKNLDPERADRFYKALVRRCSETEIGRAADRRRWFPPLDF
ncbi:MAG: hypothetical protein AAGM22_14195, partial [Acidobacteriota bacterium]